LGNVSKITYFVLGGT